MDHETIYESEATIVTRALLGDKSYIVKRLKSRRFSRLRREFKIAAKIPGDRIVRPLRLEESEDSVALIFEDHGGRALSELLNGERPHPFAQNAAFLKLALSIARGLLDIHRHGLIHCDLKPANIIIDAASGEGRIIDFGIAVERDAGFVRSSGALRGTLAYMAPEQSGRMNRTVDHRADLYALGATLYEVLAGRPPFEASEDPLLIIHRHLATAPRDPLEYDDRIPRAFADIVLKLLAKDPEDRYQTAAGVIADLEECQRRKRAGVLTEDIFEPGRKDVSDRFFVSEKLFGRADASEALGEEWRKTVAGHRVFVLVGGFAGVGKSSLVLEMQRDVLARRGFFLRGKFDQYRNETPYGAFQAAFHQLAVALLKAEPLQLAALAEKLRVAVAPNGRILVELAPQLERILGSQPPLASVSPEAAEQRFAGALRSFVRALADPEHPLLLFLDDLHWADPASLRLIHELLSDAQIGSFLLIGAYRDNEVAPGHPLQSALRQIQDAGLEPSRIQLEALESGDVLRLLAASLQAEPDDLRELAEFAWQISGGNPLFLRELLLSLRRAGAIAYDANAGVWRYDLRAARSMSAPEEVAELMALRIESLAPEERRLLGYAACAGNRFELKVLAPAGGLTPERAAELLDPALRAGLISRRLLDFDAGEEDSGEAPREVAREELPENSAEDGYVFQHDKIQQSAYDSLEASERRGVHADLARSMLAFRPVSPGADFPEIFAALADLKDEELFAIVHHVIAAEERWSAEPLFTVAVYLRGGERALASTAAQAARQYLAAGRDLLGDRGWDNQYGVTLAMHESYATAAFLCADFEAADATVETILARARLPLDRVAACEIRMAILAVNGDFAANMDVGLTALDHLGIRLPRRPGALRSIVSFLLTYIRIQFIGTDAIRTAPDLKDPRLVAQVRLLSQMVTSTYRTHRNLLPLVAGKGVLVSYRCGITPLSPLTLMIYALVLSGIGLRRQAVRIGERALELMQDRVPPLANALFVYGGMIVHHVLPLEDATEFLERGAVIGLQNGDLEYYGYCRYYATIHSIYSVGDLQAAEGEMQEQRRMAAGQRNANWLNLVEAYAETIGSLRSPGTDSLHTQAQEDAALETLRREEAWGVIALRGSARALTHYLFFRNPEAQQAIQLARRYFEYVSGMYFAPLCEYLNALIELRLAGESRGRARRGSLRRAAKVIRSFRRYAKNNSVTYAHKLRLLEAERERVKNRPERAAALYNTALEGATTQRYIFDEALICELAGEFYAARGQLRVARGYSDDARLAYARWGARGKVRHLEARLAERYQQTPAAGARKPGGVDDNRSESPSVGLEATLAASSHNPGNLDLETLSRAAEVFFAVREPAEIRAEFLRLALENAGARRALLILRRRPKDEFWIEAEIDAAREDSRTVSTEKATAYREAAVELSREVVNFAVQERTAVILEDASVRGNFTDDPYIRQRRSKSILAAPIAHQGETIGVLYLENDLAANVFSRERLRVLDVLSHQVAISLENARIYEEMQSEIGRQSRELVNLKLARNRMDPHLLFNALNMIHVLMKKDPARANAALLSLGNLYHSLTEISSEDSIAFEREWRLVLDYLKLMDIRFANTLTVAIEAPTSMPESVSRMLVPALCLQPFVENCFKHAFRNSGDDMRIRVALRLADESPSLADEDARAIVVEIEDNGAGFAEERPSGATLRSIGERLAHYNPGSSLQLSNTEAGARVRVRIATQ